MQHTNTLRNFKLLYLVVVGLIISWSAYATPIDDEDNDCNTVGYVLDKTGLDGCGFVILLEDGNYLEPVEIDDSIELRDSMHIRFGYEPLDAGSICMMGDPVAILCLEEINDDSMDCYVGFEYVAVKCYDSTNSSKCGEYSYQFTGYASPEVTSWQWMVNGDIVCQSSSFVYQFDGAGQYEVCLGIETELGCTAQYCEVIVIDTPNNCKAYYDYYPIDWLANPDSTYLPDTLYPSYYGNIYQFYDYSRGNPTEWEWTIDGEVFSREQNPMYTFDYSGVFEICLTIETASGCTDTYCDVVSVDMSCHANFTYYSLDNSWIYEDSISYEGGQQDSLYVPIDSIDCTSAYSPYCSDYAFQFVDYSRGNISYWLWDFGDGTTSDEQNPIHVFSGPGEYEVCLTVYNELDDDSCNDTYCVKVIVRESCEAYFEYCSYHLSNIADSVLDYTEWGDTIPNDERLLIGFKNMSKPAGGYSYWQFGDGHYSTEKNPVHEYTEPGVYTVCLYYYTDWGCYDQYCQEIYVGIDECEVDFTYQLAIPNCQGFQVAHAFEAIQELETFYYSWSFGDGEYSSEQNPIHIFPSYGTYETCLEVYYDNGCRATKCMSIVVNADTVDHAFQLKCGISPVHNSFYEGSLSVSKAYPVPAVDYLNLEVSSEKSQRIRIDMIDIVGKTNTVLDNYEISSGSNNIQVELDKFKTGTYIYSIVAEDKIIRGKVSISK